jgi:hypothetical protein
MSKFKFKGSEGLIKGIAFILFGKKWIIALSETKWHSGEKHKRTPIWFSNIGGNIPAMFVWKLAIGFEKRKE